MIGLFWQSFKTRFVFFALAASLGGFIYDYDLSAHLVLPSQTGSHIPDTELGLALSSLCKWDSLYFIKISHDGYEYEKTTAFFPLYPLLIRWTAVVLKRFDLFDWVNIDEMHLIAAYLISWCAFSLAVIYIRELSLVILKNARKANSATMLFLLSPAGVFFTAIYTESLFALLSVAGMFYLWRHCALIDSEKHEQPAYQVPAIDRVYSTILFALATATRSNGSLLAIFPVYIFVHNVFVNLNRHGGKQHILLEAMSLSVSLLVHWMPSFAYLSYVGGKFCSLEEPSDYCDNLFPNVYSFVQAKHW
mmetsp:Transcript_7565/g.14101  ORF Transcript_7565/g.14101 Transcript_7565/m.14101 type:complete len:305 (-) Transcript_7565:604-1518(-)